jgi:DNA-binding response OmpR family regulator
LKAIATSLLKQANVLPIETSVTTSVDLLLVEDHGDTARVLQRILASAGYGVAHASNMKQARDLARERNFDLVISDLGLPDGSGLELMRFLGETQGLSGIALSGFGSAEDVEASAAAGFAEHLTKPIDWPQLRAAIDRLLVAKGQKRPAIVSANS